MILKALGIIGFLFKAFLYSLIGVLICETAVGKQTNSSPQGAFILLGSFVGGPVLLVLCICGLIIYSSWRFWEGFLGQGSNPSRTKWSNFFSYRLSPFVSGSVYVSYAIYILTVLLNKQDLPQPGESTGKDKHCFPSCWTTSVIGKVGVSLVAFGLSLGSLVQLVSSIRLTFMRDIYPLKNKKIERIIKYSGILGFIGRGLLFLLISIFFWKLVIETPVVFDIHEGSFSQALNSIRDTIIGKIVLMTIGLFLVIYGLHALLCVFYRTFPTPSPPLV